MAECSKCIHIDVCGKLVFFGRNCNKECIHYKDGSNLVEVVRCKNCRYYNEDGEYCSMWGEVRHPEHFCDEGVKDNG